MKNNDSGEVFGVMAMGGRQQQILARTPVLGRESVHILDSLARVLAQDIVVAEDFPAADISAMDGYAVRHSSLVGVSERTPVQLRIIGESPAGRPSRCCVQEGEAVRIMTGGVIPAGADTVVKLEDASEHGGYVRCSTDPGQGDSILFCGGSLKKGEVVLCAGDLIGPVEVGVLASLKRPYVYVHQKPLVAVLAVGGAGNDVPVRPTREGHILDPQLYALAAQVVESGAVPLCLGTARDEPVAQQALLAEALRADVILVSGETAPGKYGPVGEVLASLGMDAWFSAPSGTQSDPMLFGTVGRRVVFGLPGTSSAAMLCFEQFIKPAFFKMMGHRIRHSCHGESHWREVNGPLSIIDSFAQENAGIHGHYRASLVPMGKPSPLNGGSNGKAKRKGAPIPGSLTRVTH